MKGVSIVAGGICVAYALTCVGKAATQSRVTELSESYAASLQGGSQKWCFPLDDCDGSSSPQCFGVAFFCANLNPNDECSVVFDHYHPEACNATLGNDYCTVGAENKNVLCKEKYLCLCEPVLNQLTCSKLVLAPNPRFTCIITLIDDNCAWELCPDDIA